MKSDRKVTRIDVDKSGLENINLPIDIFYRIFSTFSIHRNKKTIASYAQTCSTLNHFFQPTLDHCTARLVQKLLEYAIDRKPRGKEILRILDKYPGLITKYGEITDDSNRRIGGTIYRVLLATLNPLWKEVDPYFKKIQHGEEERIRQINAQFPAEFPLPYNPKARKKYKIDKLIDAIIADKSIRFDDATHQFQMNAVTDGELQKFIDYYAPKNEVITTGLYFDPFIYVDILRAYEKRYKDFKNDNQVRLYCCLVEGGIQKLFTAYFAMLTCKGIGYLLRTMNNFENADYHKNLTDLNTKLNDDSDFYSPGLGVSHFVYSDYDVWAEEDGDIGAERMVLRPWNKKQAGAAQFQRLCEVMVADLGDHILQVQNPLGLKHLYTPVPGRGGCVIS